MAVKTQYSTSVTAAASSERIEAAAEIKGSLTLASVVQGYQTQASIGRTEECKRIRKALTEQGGLAALLARCAQWRTQRVGVVKGTDRRDGKAKGGRKLRVGQFLDFWDAAGKSQTTNEDVHFFVENCLRPPSTVAAADAFLRQREYAYVPLCDPICPPACAPRYAPRCRNIEAKVPPARVGRVSRCMMNEGLHVQEEKDAEGICPGNAAAG